MKNDMHVIKAVSPSMVSLEAEPEPVQIDINRTALIIIDMQNTFVKKGGIFDHQGTDLSVFDSVISTIKSIYSAAKNHGLKVIYIAHVISHDFRETGGPDSGFGFKLRRSFILDKNGKVADNQNFRDTWGAKIISELEPQADDIYVEKPRFSAFFGTNLDTILKTFNIKYLAFTGTSTNICVETSLRDALNLGYYNILISDATVGNTPAAKEAAIVNIKAVFGWVTNSQNFIQAIQKAGGNK
jgi:ureidoacrylate peracid hydrolase